MLDTERRKLENQLVVMGLARLEDPALVIQFAEIINRYGGHDFFEAMLGECEPVKRGEMYEALRPHLNFKALPLEKYISNIKERAGNIASAHEPICVGDDKYEEVNRARAEGVVATFTCYKCTKTQDFYGESPAAAATMARSYGWVRDVFKQKEICPHCPAIMPEERTH
jgi:hypothetical protein